VAVALGNWRGDRGPEGRTPRPEDLLVPGWFEDQAHDVCRHRDLYRMRSDLRDDLATLVLPQRRLYHDKRTFLALCLADGGRKDILRWVAHGPSGIVEAYTTLPWDAVCAEVVKLGINLSGEQTLSIPPAGEGGPRPPSIEGQDAISRQAPSDPQALESRVATEPSGAQLLHSQIPEGPNH
jgi:hypothetical protein